MADRGNFGLLGIGAQRAELLAATLAQRSNWSVACY